MTKIKYSIVFLAGLGVLMSAGSASAQRQKTRDITVNVGEQKSISADGVLNYSEGVGGIVDVRLTKNEDRFVLVGLRPGNTSLLLIMEEERQLLYKITVPDPNPGKGPKDPNQVDQAPNIRLDLYFVQLSDNYNHNIGLRWPDVIGGGGSQSDYRFQFGRAAGTSQSSHQFQISALAPVPRLDLAQAKGYARLYRQVALVTANGFSSSFNNGGEVNVAVAGQVTGRIQRIDFGTKLTCTPRYDEESGRIELKVSATVSDLTPAGTSGIPGKILSEIDTVVNLELGEAVVLGGFLARSDRKSRSGIPGLSQIPILGALFGTHASSSEETEGLMFIVPSVVDAVPLRKRNRIQEALRVYEDFAGGIEDVDLLEQPRISR